jgi:hypothetical protein
MPRKKYTREIIIQTLQNLAKCLSKNTLTTKEINKIIPESTVSRYFGSATKALEAAGLEKNQNVNPYPKGTVKISDDELFQSILEVESKTGKVPGFYDYSADGKYSTFTINKRFGKWEDVISHYRKW